MYMKVFPHGKGGGHAPTHYLVRMDYPGRKECPPQVLRGNVALTRKLIDSLDTTWKFTAGVLSWHPDDIVTAEQERKVMDSFEAVAFAGLAEDQRNILWVRHGHAGHPELHFVIPRVELGSGNAFNPCPPGWQKAFDIFRDLLNITEGWASPDDPARARIHTPDHADLHRARLIRWGKKPSQDERADAKNAIHTYLRALIEDGIIRNREDVLAALRDAGLEIHRIGKDYVSVKDPDSEEKLRLKGGIYAERFEAEQLEFALGAHPSPSPHRQAERTNADTGRVQHLAEELERVIHARAQFNRKRYPRPADDYGEENLRPLPDYGEYVRPPVQDSPDMELRDADDDGPDHRRDDSLGAVPDSGIGKRDRRAEEGGSLAYACERDVADTHGGHSRRNVSYPAEVPHVGRGLDLQGNARLETGVAHDRTRTHPERYSRRADQGTRRAHRPASGTAGYPEPGTHGNEPRTVRTPATTGGIGAALDALELCVRQLEALARKAEQLLERKVKRAEQSFGTWFGMRR
ncbi:MAG: relaxase/mobilization nuclease domain-containing protein [Mailhella sp.]|nr:relaxase/mobilization nuclease domain-containing protein [Mailhella sp.]